MLNQNIFGFTTKNKRSIKPLNYQVDLTKLEATSQIFIQENMKKTILFGGSSDVTWCHSFFLEAYQKMYQQNWKRQ